MRYEHADYKDTDDRGRVTLGNEHANSKVAVAWADVGEPEPAELYKPTEEEREKLGELYDWAVENGHKALDFDVERGRIYMENAEWIDTDVEGLADE